MNEVEDPHGLVQEPAPENLAEQYDLWCLENPDSVEDDFDASEAIEIDQETNGHIRRWLVAKAFSRGGQAHLNLAWDARTGTYWAFKISRKAENDLAEVNEHLRLESEVMAWSLSPNIIFPKDFFTYIDHEGNERSVSVLPYLKGRSLDDRIASGEILEIKEIKTIFQDIIEALMSCYANGVFHRDLKPDNILISGGRAYLNDFGISNAVIHENLDRFSVRYVAPEGFSSKRGLFADQRQNAEFEQRVDVFALGAMLYEIITGENLIDFSSKDPKKIRNYVREFYAGLDGSQEFLLADNLHTNFGFSEFQFRDLIYVIRKAVHQNAHERYAGAEVFFRALDAAFAQISIQSIQNRVAREEASAHPGFVQNIKNVFSGRKHTDSNFPEPTPKINQSH